MGEAAFWGFIGASSLIIAAEVAFGFKLSRMVIGLVMAFGVGALISSVSFELVAPAMQNAEGWQVALALACGSVVCVYAYTRLAQPVGKGRKKSDGIESSDHSDGSDDEGEEKSGLGIVLGTVLDGIPESAVLGMSLVGGGSVSVSLLAGIWISNFPESLSSSVNLEKTGMPRT